MHMWGPGICLGQPRQVIKEGTSELLVKLTQKSEEEEELDPAGPGYKMAREKKFL